MGIRPALLDNVVLSLEDGTAPVEVDAYDLGPNTSFPPTEDTTGTQVGDRPVGVGYAPVVQVLRSTEFDTFDDYQVDGRLLRIVANYDDGSSATFKSLGFTVRADEPVEIGGLSGFTITAKNNGQTDADVLGIAPVLGA